MKVQCLGLFLILICVNNAFSTDKNLRKHESLKPAGTSHIGTLQDAGFEHILYNPPIFNSKKDFHIKFQTPEEAAKIEAYNLSRFGNLCDLEVSCTTWKKAPETGKEAL